LFYLSCSLCADISPQYLTLSHLGSLTVICKEDIANLMQPLHSISMFSYLKTFSISECHKIKTLMTSNLVPQLQNVESIIVEFCNSIEQIFAMTYGDSNKITLPKLANLEVKSLPQLKAIDGCPNLCKPIIECVD